MKEERVVNSILLKECRSLINQGVENIRIRSNNLFVNSILYGKVINASFTPVNDSPTD